MRYLILIIVIVFMSSCLKFFESLDDNLSIPRTDYTGNQLKIDGYYYHHYNNADEMRVAIRFLYRNGIYLYGGNTIIGSELTEREVMFADGSYYDIIKDSKTRWGVFIIEGAIIKIESWTPSEIKLAYVYEGIILNDTTFHIKESYRIRKGNKTDIRIEDNIYHYKQFSPKPDSTNVFVN